MEKLTVEIVTLILLLIQQPGHPSPPKEIFSIQTPSHHPQQRRPCLTTQQFQPVLHLYHHHQKVSVGNTLIDFSCKCFENFIENFKDFEEYEARVLPATEYDFDKVTTNLLGIGIYLCL